MPGAIEPPIGRLNRAAIPGRGLLTIGRDKIWVGGRLAPKERDGVNDIRLGRTPDGPKTLGAPRPAPKERPFWKAAVSALVPI